MVLPGKGEAHVLSCLHPGLVCLVAFSWQCLELGLEYGVLRACHYSTQMVPLFSG